MKVELSDEEQLKIHQEAVKYLGEIESETDPVILRNLIYDLKRENLENKLIISKLEV